MRQVGVELIDVRTSWSQQKHATLHGMIPITKRELVGSLHICVVFRPWSCVLTGAVPDFF